MTCLSDIVHTMAAEDLAVEETRGSRRAIIGQILLHES